MTHNKIGNIPPRFHTDLPTTHPFSGAQHVSEFASKQRAHLDRRTATQSALKAHVTAVGDNLRTRADSIRPTDGEEAAAARLSLGASHAATPLHMPKSAKDAIVCEAEMLSRQARLQYKWKVRNELQRWIPRVGGTLAVGALVAGVAWYAIGMAFGIVTFSLAVLALMTLVSYFSLKPHLVKCANQLERLSNDMFLNSVRAVVPDNEVKARLKVSAGQLPDLDPLAKYSFTHSDKVQIPPHRDGAPWKEMSLAECRGRMVAAQQALDDVESSVKSALGEAPEPLPWYMKAYARFFVQDTATDVTTLQLDYWRERFKYWNDLNQTLEKSLPSMSKASMADCQAISHAIKKTRAYVRWAQAGLSAAEAAMARARSHDAQLTDAFYATSAYWRQMAPAPTFASTPTRSAEVLQKWRSGVVAPEVPLPKAAVPRRAFDMDIADLRYYEKDGGVRTSPIDDAPSSEDESLRQVFPNFNESGIVEFPESAAELLEAILDENTVRVDADKGVIRDAAGEPFQLLKLVTDMKWLVFARAVKEMTPASAWPTSYESLSADIVRLTDLESKRHAKMHAVMQRFCNGQDNEQDRVFAELVENDRGHIKSLDDVLCEQLQKLTCEHRYKRRLRDSYAQEMTLTGFASNLRNVLAELQAPPSEPEASQLSSAPKPRPMVLHSLKKRGAKTQTGSAKTHPPKGRSFQPTALLRNRRAEKLLEKQLHAARASVAARGVTAKHALLTGYRVDQLLQRPLIQGEEALIETILQRCIEQARARSGKPPTHAQGQAPQTLPGPKKPAIQETLQLQALKPRPTVAEKAAAYAHYKSAIAQHFVGEVGATALRQLLAKTWHAGQTVSQLALDLVARSAAPDDVAALRAMVLRELFDVTKSALNQQNNSPHAIDLTPEGIRVTQAKFAQRIPCDPAYFAGLIAAAKVARLHSGTGTGTVQLTPSEHFEMLHAITVSILREHMPKALRQAAELYWTLRNEVLNAMLGQWQKLEPAADEQARLDRAMQIATNFRAKAGHADVEWLEGEHRGALTRHYRAFLNATGRDRQEAQGRFQDAVGRLAQAALALKDGALAGQVIPALEAQHDSAAMRKARRLFGSAIKADSANRVGIMQRGRIDLRLDNEEEEKVAAPSDPESKTSEA